MSYSFYIQKTDKAGTAQGSVKNLEVDFPGLSYASCKGLNSFGKAKNIYSENYAEQDGDRIYHPKDNVGGVLHLESTNVELTLVFSGASRRASYESFRTFVTDGRMYYWDTARHRKVWLVLKEAVEPTDDILKGIPFIMATFKFTNLWGMGKACNDSGVLQ